MPAQVLSPARCIMMNKALADPTDTRLIYCRNSDFCRNKIPLAEGRFCCKEKLYGGILVDKDEKGNAVHIPLEHPGFNLAPRD